MTPMMALTVIHVSLRFMIELLDCITEVQKLLELRDDALRGPPRECHVDIDEYYIWSWK
jgi:hypothetical protein